MAFLPLADKSTTAGHARDVLLETEKRWGYVPNIVRALALRPELLDAEDHWSKALMYSGKLPRVLKEAVATTVSTVNDCNYCATSHALAAELAGGAKSVGEACALLRFDTFTEKERVALEFACKGATDMNSVTKQDVDKLRKYYSPEEIVELSAVIGSFMMYNTFVTLLGLELEPVHDKGLLAPVKNGRK